MTATETFQLMSIPFHPSYPRAKHRIQLKWYLRKIGWDNSIMKGILFSRRFKIPPCDICSKVYELIVWEARCRRLLVGQFRNRDRCQWLQKIYTTTTPAQCSPQASHALYIHWWWRGCLHWSVGRVIRWYSFLIITGININEMISSCECVTYIFSLMQCLFAFHFNLYDNILNY
jgi:hypothetical protein